MSKSICWLLSDRLNSNHSCTEYLDVEERNVVKNIEVLEKDTIQNELGNFSQKVTEDTQQNESGSAASSINFAYQNIVIKQVLMCSIC